MCWVWALLWARQTAPPKIPRVFIFTVNVKYPNGVGVEADEQIPLSSLGSSWAPITCKCETEKCDLGVWTLFPVQFWNHHVLNTAAIIFMLYLGFHLIFRSIFVSAQTGCFVRGRFHLVFPQPDTSNASPLHFGSSSGQLGLETAVLAAQLSQKHLCPCPLCLKTQQLCHKTCTGRWALTCLEVL